MNRTKTLRVAAWTVAGVVGLVLLAWLAVPLIVKSQLESRASALLGRDVRVADVSFAPWALSLTLRGLTVAAAPGSAASAPQFEVARLHVDADLRSLVRLAPVLEAIEIDAPKLRLARTGASQLDIDDIIARLKPAQPAPPAVEPMRFALFNLQLRDGEVDFDDRPVERKHTLREVQVALPFLSNLVDDVEVKVEPRLAFALDGTAFDLRGQSVPFASHRTTELAIKLADLPLARWWAYVPGKLPARPEGGVLAADLKLKFAQPPGQVPRIGLAGTTSLRDLGLRSPSGEPLVGFKRLAVQLDDVRPLEHQLSFGPVRLEGLEVDVRRDARGQLEWATLVGQGGAPPADKPAEPAAGAPKGAPWKVSVGRAELVGALVRWHDATLQPAAQFALEALDVSAERLRWPTEGEAPIQASVRVLSGAQEVAQLKLQGEASDKRAVLALEADAVQLGAAAPYLRGVLRPTLEGRARISGGLEWAAGEAPRLALAVKSLQLDDLRLADRAGVMTAPRNQVAAKTARGRRDAPATVVSIAIEDANVDLLARTVAVGAVRVRQPSITLRRDVAGVIDATQWVAAPAPPDTAPPPPKTAPTSAPPWRAQLKDLLLEGGQLDWSDAAVRPAAPVVLNLRGLRVAAQGVAWPPSASPIRLQLAAQLRVPPAEPGAPAAPPGRLDARGQGTLAPLSARGTLALERLPVAAFEPYFGAALPVLLQRGELGVRGDFDFKQGAEGPTLNARGDVLLADVRVNSRVANGGIEGGDELLSWQSLTIKPLTVALAPGAKPRVEVDELALSDFFARLTITEQGRFNLSDVQAQPVAGAAPSSAALPASAAPAASAPADRPLQNLPIDLVVGGTRLANGRVDFTDRFIRPNYSAALSELNGTIGRVATGTRDMATVDLRGRVAGTGLLEIRGAVNPTAKPLALDISARTTDIELAPFSPYAGKYAGYGIERGKLSLDVAYRIDADGKLDAKNQLTLNQLTFGEATNSPDATKLPVRLLISLLTDRNGVIDLNLPVSGSINDPQFSIFGLVLQVIGNLLAKAVTAPFSLLSGGGTADLSLVEFVPGTTQIAEASRATIDRVAKALVDRPSLRMTVVGAADPVSEGAAMQAAALEARVQSEAQRDRARAGVTAVADATPPPLSAEERTRLVKRIYADTKLPDKPRNLIGFAKDIPLAEMESMLKAATVVSTDTARELALQRGLAVRDALIAKGLPSDRLFLGAPKLRASGEDDAAWTPRVQLTLAGA